MALPSWALLHGTLLLDAAAFDRVGARLDTPLAARLEALIGYVGILGVALAQRRCLGASPFGPLRVPFSILALVAYGFHLFVLRWPWLTGSAEPGNRLDYFGAVLSATWHGMPVVAFGELLAMAVIGVHGYVGLCVASPYARLREANPRIHWAVSAAALLVYAMISGVVVGLATGRY